MGLAMGGNFLKAGYPLVVHDKLNDENVEKLVQQVNAQQVTGCLF